MRCKDRKNAKWHRERVTSYWINFVDPELGGVSIEKARLAALAPDLFIFSSV
jgi:hypothetical protein